MPDPLEHIDRIRYRPVMYVGLLGSSGLHVLLDEVVGLCLEGAARRATSQIDVTLHADGTLSVADNGPGLPAGCSPEGEPAGLAYSCTHLGDASLVPREWGATRTGQLFVCANALAAWFEAEVRRADGRERQRFERGYPVATPPSWRPNTLRTSGSCFRWLPDLQLFPDATCEPYLLRNRLRTHALLASPVRITLTDEHTDTHQEFQFDQGVADFVEVLNTGYRPRHTPIRVEHRADWGDLSAAFQYLHPGPMAKALPEKLLGFVNHLPTSSGTHVDAVRGALTIALNDHARRLGLLNPTDVELKASWLLANLTGVVSIRMPSPPFQGKYRQRLGAHQLFHEMETAIRTVIENAVNTDPHTATTFSHVIRAAISQRDGEARRGHIPSLLKPAPAEER